jgi:hypothetical protein
MVAQGYGVGTSPLELGYALNRVGLFNYANLLGGNTDSVVWGVSQAGLLPMLMHSALDVMIQLSRGSSVIALVGPPVLSPSGYDHAIVAYGYRPNGPYGPETEILDPLGRVTGWWPIQYLWDSRSLSYYDYGSYDSVIVAVNSTAFDVPDPIEGQKWVFRLYNPDSAEHLYTTDEEEAGRLAVNSWIYEGVGWASPTIGEPVYRLHNPILGDHHYTRDWNEVSTLTALYNWVYEGISWYSGGSDALFRLFNPSLTAGSHHYTRQTHERDTLIAEFGWIPEEVGWYGIE